MPEDRHRQYTPEQRKVVDEAADTLDRALEEVRARLVAVGLTGDLEWSRCTQCSCPYFVDRGPGDTPPAPPDIPGTGMRCWRIGCTHSRRDHLAFI
jgi:hypothetical protein